MYRTRLLAGKTAIVTGASSGIGRAIALTYALEGARVMVADLHEEAVEGGQPTTELIRQEGGTGMFMRTDISRWDDVDAVVTEAIKLYGRLDVMVNNAATYSGTALLETTSEQWDSVLSVNMTGMFNGCKRAIQQMRLQEPHEDVRGRVINLGSQHGIICARGELPYGVSKAGAIYLTRQIAVDYAKDHIVCNCISPGKIVTGKPGIDDDPERLARAAQRTPWPRLGRPQDIANAAVFLASDRATFITGSNLMVDGGWLAG
jgi:NAD(P)-dependent dehydrogenase (short-subunit alcohol dehydrogenase family)